MACTSCSIKMGSWTIKAHSVLGWIMGRQIFGRMSVSTEIPRKWMKWQDMSFMKCEGLCEIITMVYHPNLSASTFYFALEEKELGQATSQRLQWVSAGKRKARKASHYSQLYMHNKGSYLLSPSCFPFTFLLWKMLNIYQADRRV